MFGFHTPDWMITLSDFGGALFSVAAFLFMGGLAVHAYFMRRMPSHLHIALHFWREENGKKPLKVPTMARMVLPQIYPIILATWVLIRSRSWAWKSNFRPVLTIRPVNGWWRLGRLLCRGLPTADDVMDPLVRYLSELETVEWLDRTKDIRCNTTYQAPEAKFVVGLVCDEDSPSVRAVVIPLEFIEQVQPNGSDGLELHPLYGRAKCRVNTLRKLKEAYDEWLANKNSGLCIAVVEL